MSFDQGLSGLNASSTQIDVIGNNIANASTVGFKASTADFADVYASSLGGGGASSVGIGVTSQVAQQFTQGTVSTDNNPLDIAINGNGFFQISNNGTVSYTRNGQFSLNENGDIVTSSGGNLQGYNANANGVLNTGVTTNIVISSANIPPKTTSTGTTVLNLDSQLPVLTDAAFSTGTPSTYSYSTSMTVYDSLGNSHSLQTYYVNNGVTAPSTEDKWSVFATLDGTSLSTLPAPVGTLAFTTSGALDATTSTGGGTIAFPFTLTNGATSPQTVSINFTGTTQFGAASSVDSQTQNGFSSGELTQFSAGSNGIITGTYSNGQTQTLAQIVLNNFVNPGGLQSAGDNQWYSSSTSGVALLGTPGTGSFGVLQSSAVENSTTDLTSELVALITAQQNYQASAQTIKTEEDIDQSLINLR